MEDARGDPLERLRKKISNVMCRKKHLTFDGKPYRLEVWGSRFPLFFTSFETEIDCQVVRETLLKFLDTLPKDL
jgi:hypothetical protein